MKLWLFLPNQGLEPWATGLKGQHSTNWVNPVQKGLTGIRTQVRGFKVLGDNHYTIRPHNTPMYTSNIYPIYVPDTHHMSPNLWLIIVT